MSDKWAWVRCKEHDSNHMTYSNLLFITRLVNLYNATQDIYLVSRQCRHYDISMTMRYMRSLGVIVDEKLRQADFKY
jgi:hypothetical protein